ncbi:MAG TPA: XrtA system polysaccharide deacetylase, partial [Methylomirabilota bacterium]|nr:XrtA system polysaccharide deacetylase [Methylomirabilota bacterium]
MINALSFDVEDYFHAHAFSGIVRFEEWPSLEERVVTNTRRLLDLLDKCQVSATFFTLGWVAERHPSLIREIARRGHEVGCHGYAHRLVYAMTPAEFRTDTARAKAAIEDAIGAPILGYRAPTFSITRESLWALEILYREGFRYDSSIFPIVHDRYGIPNAPRFPHKIALPDGREIVEFPLSTSSVAGQRIPVAGGGYLRLIPYRLLRAALRRINVREGGPVIIYLHPWELDPE